MRSSHWHSPRPELLEHTLYLVGTPAYVVCSIVLGLKCYSYACRHESAQQARRAMRTADPLPSPPITAGAATAMLCVLGLAGACVTVAALILF